MMALLIGAIIIGGLLLLIACIEIVDKLANRRNPIARKIISLSMYKSEEGTYQ